MKDITVEEQNTVSELLTSLARSGHCLVTKSFCFALISLSSLSAQ